MNPHFQRASILLEQSRTDQAEEELRKALQEDPEDAAAHALLAICLAEGKKFAEATREVETAIHLSPENPYGFYAQSYVLSERNHFPEARDAIQQAIGLDPYQPHYFAKLSQVQFNMRQWQEALNAAELGLQLDPEHVTCTNLRAMALVKLGRKTEATHALGTALKRDPEDAYSHANLGWSLIERGQNEEAMEHFREALRLDPNLEWARVGIIEAMKARYFVYRIILNWFLWMMKLSSQAQWGVIVGGYIGFQVLRRIAAANPNLAPWLLPLIVAYITFAIMTWVAVPLFNLALRLNRFGRLALSAEQIRTSNWVGLCVLGAVGFIVAYFAMDELVLLIGALCCGLMIPVLGNIYNCSLGWPRAAVWLMTIALASLTAVMIVLSIGSVVLSDSLATAARLTADSLFPMFAIAAIASQFGVTYLASVRPRNESTRQVWLAGSFALVLLWLILGAKGVSLFESHYKEAVRGTSTAPPLRVDVVQRQNIHWKYPAAMNEATAELEQLGFVNLGDYVYDGMKKGPAYRFLIQEEKSVVAEITELTDGTASVSLYSGYDDGTRLVYTNGFGPDLELSGNLTRKRFRDSPATLFQRMVADRPVGSLRNLTAAQVPEFIEEKYASEADFLYQKGGYNAAELRAISETQGSFLPESTIPSVQLRWRRDAAKNVDDFVLEQFLAQNPQLKHSRDRLFCIHGLQNHQDHMRLLEGLNIELYQDPQVARVFETHTTARNHFAKIAELRNNFIKVGQTDTPIPTDIYLIHE